MSHSRAIWAGTRGAQARLGIGSFLPEDDAIELTDDAAVGIILQDLSAIVEDESPSGNAAVLVAEEPEGGL